MTVQIKLHDGREMDFAALPEASQRAIALRGIAHIYGNEVASQVVGKIKAAVAGENRKIESVETAEITAYRKANEEQVDAWKAELVAAKTQAMLEGKLGDRAPGVGRTVDPLMREMTRIAVEEIAEIFAAHKLGKMPRGEETVKLGDKTFDRSALIERRLAQHGERIKKEAAAVLAARARKAKAISESEASLAEVLGL